MVRPHPSSVGDIDSFVTLLRVACEEPAIRATLDKVLTLPSDQRQGMLHFLLQDMSAKGAPQDFVEAIACLQNDEIAQKAYEVIFQSQPQRGFFDSLRSSH